MPEVLRSATAKDEKGVSFTNVIHCHPMQKEFGNVIRVFYLNSDTVKVF